MAQQKSASTESLPRVMVLSYQPELTHSVWVDFMHRCRTMTGLIALLNREVKSGRIVGYRLIRVEKEIIGCQ